MPAIIYSSLDPAGCNIAEHLRKLYNFKPAGDPGGKFPFWRNSEGIVLVEIDTPTITSDYIDTLLKTDLIVFASKHKSESGKPTLTAHPCGNWDGKAEFGGKPRTLAPTSAPALKAAMLELAKSQLPGFEVVMECTHHGPLLNTPFLFVEIGSTEKEWSIPEAGELVAKACYAACVPSLPPQRIAIGIGGIHYPREISKEILRTDIAVGHICPKYMMGQLDERMLGQMLEKSGGKVDLALIDWKSLKKEERERALSLLKIYNTPFEKV